MGWFEAAGAVLTIPESALSAAGATPKALGDGGGSTSASCVVAGLLKLGAFPPCTTITSGFLELALSLLTTVAETSSEAELSPALCFGSELDPAGCDGLLAVFPPAALGGREVLASESHIC